MRATYNLSLEQLEWRRWCIKNNCRGNEDAFRQEYPACPEEAFLMSGRPVFDLNVVAQRIAQLEEKYKKAPYETGLFLFEWNNAGAKDSIINETIRYASRKDGEVRIYAKPEDGVPYVIGADTKGEGRDFYAATVINNITGERVAQIHMQVNESKPFTYQLYCLGKYYNDALIGVEMNFNTAPIEELERLWYPNQYVRRTYDSYNKKEQKKYGWRTDGNTRPLIIDKEIDLINHNIELFNDVEMLRECMTFVYDDNGRPDAVSGKHDDLLFSDMIANEIRAQQRFTREEKQTPDRYKTDIDDFMGYGG